MSKFILSALFVVFALLNAAEAQRVAFGFGTNAAGEQGQTITTPTNIAQLPALAGKNISMIATGDRFTLVHTNSPYATYSFGRNNAGQLGQGNTNNINVPTPIAALNGVQVLSMAAGSEHAVVITSGNDVYAMGANNHGQLGLNDTTSRNEPTLVSYFNNTAPRNAKLNTVVCGDNHCHLYNSADASQAPFGMGKNDLGQLLLGNTDGSLSPRRLSATGILEVSCGGDFTLARSANAVLCGGKNDMGQCGQGNTNVVPNPSPISVANGTTFRMIKSCSTHSLAITSDNKVWAWGSNGKGEAGMNSTTNMFTTPMLIPSLAMENATMIGCGTSYSVAINDMNFMFGWGENAQKQLGLDTNTPQVIAPIPVTSIAQIANITMGTQYTYVLSNGRSHSLGHIRGPMVPTQAPTTQAPTTQAPTTQAPTTQAPQQSTGAKQTVVSGFLVAIAAFLIAQF